MGRRGVDRCLPRCSWDLTSKRRVCLPGDTAGNRSKALATPLWRGQRAQLRAPLRRSAAHRAKPSPPCTRGASAMQCPTLSETGRVVNRAGPPVSSSQCKATALRKLAWALAQQAHPCVPKARLRARIAIRRARWVPEKEEKGQDAGAVLVRDGLVGQMVPECEAGGTGTISCGGAACCGRPARAREIQHRLRRK